MELLKYLNTQIAPFAMPSLSVLKNNIGTINIIGTVDDINTVNTSNIAIGSTFFDKRTFNLYVYNGERFLLMSSKIGGIL